MKTISNADYQEALRLLRHLSRKKGDSISERNASRRAGLLVKRWDKTKEK